MRALTQYCGRVRLIRVLERWRLFGRLLQQDFDTYTNTRRGTAREHLARRASPHTVRHPWHVQSDHQDLSTHGSRTPTFPRKEVTSMVSWLTGHVRRRDVKKTSRAPHLLRPHDMSASFTWRHNVRRPRHDTTIFWRKRRGVARRGKREPANQTPRAPPTRIHSNPRRENRTAQRAHRRQCTSSLTVWRTPSILAADNPRKPVWVPLPIRDEPPGHPEVPKGIARCCTSR